MRVIIVGLRRSGTTAFWRTWRQDKRFVCFDEPFGSGLTQINDSSWKDLAYSRIEMRKLWERDPLAFWNNFAPIQRSDEFRRGMSSDQRSYLSWLFESARHVCIDVTRCHFKIAQLKQVAPDAILVHLRRPPQNWLTSIALPSHEKVNWIQSGHWRTWRKFTRNTRNALSKRRFWTAKRGFGFQGYEEILGYGSDSLFGFRLRESGMDPETICRLPLVGRLLALWKLFGDEVESEGPKHFGNHFFSINFNDFCGAPRGVIEPIYERLGEEAPLFDFGGIRPPPTHFDPQAPQWLKLFEALEIDNRWLADEGNV